MSMFDDLLKTKEFQEQLALLSEEDKKVVLKSLRELVENFENGIIKPFEKIKGK